MSMVWEERPLDECRAPRFSAAHCQHCGYNQSLVLDAEAERFECRDKQRCRERAEAGSY